MHAVAYMKLTTKLVLLGLVLCECRFAQIYIRLRTSNIWWMYPHWDKISPEVEIFKGSKVPRDWNHQIGSSSCCVTLSFWRGITTAYHGNMSVWLSCSVFILPIEFTIQFHETFLWQGMIEWITPFLCSYFFMCFYLDIVSFRAPLGWVCESCG